MIDKLPFTHLTAEDAKCLKALAGSIQGPGVIVEIGSYLGASSIVLAQASKGRSKIYCVDTWQNDSMSEGPRDTYAEFCRNTIEFSPILHPIRMASVDASRLITDEIDLLFIDGDHSYDGCLCDFENYFPKVKEGGLIAFHDATWADGVKRVIRRKFLQCTLSPGRLEGNIFWARITHKAKNTIQTNLGLADISIAVISHNPIVNPEHSKRFAKYCAGADVFWVKAGEHREISDAEKQSTIQIVAADDIGLLAGRHKILTLSNREIIVFLDDDVFLDEFSLRSLLEPFQDDEVHFVGCRYLPTFEHTPPEWMQSLWSNIDGFSSLAYLSLLDGGNQTIEYDPNFVWGLCFATRRHTAIGLGGFHPDGYPWKLRRFRGDGESGLTSVAKSLGCKAVYQGKTTIKHFVPKSRLTFHYLRRRAYLQGVSESYAKVRSTGMRDLQPAMKPLDFLRSMKNKVRYLLKSFPPQIETVLTRAYQNGFNYHQSQLKKSPELLAWVMKSDYFGPTHIQSQKP